MEKLITYSEAYQLYLKGKYDEMMPFENDYGYEGFIDYLQSQGFIVVGSSEVESYE